MLLFTNYSMTPKIILISTLVPNVMNFEEGGDNIIPVTIGDSDWKEAANTATRPDTWKYKWVGTTRQCGIEVQSSVDEDSGTWNVRYPAVLNSETDSVNVTIIGKYHPRYKAIIFYKSLF